MPLRSRSLVHKAHICSDMYSLLHPSRGLKGGWPQGCGWWVSSNPIRVIPVGDRFQYPYLSNSAHGNVPGGCCSVAQSCLTLCDPMDYTMPGFLVLHYLLEFAQTHAHWVGDAIQPSHPLLLLPSVFPSIRVFSNQSALCIRWPKYWSFSISPSNEYSGLISFRIDCFDLLTVQGTLKSLLQHDSSKASILGRSAFFIAQLSHPYVTTGKTIALTRWTFVSKEMSLILSMPFRFVTAFLQRSKHLSISWLQSLSAVILEPPAK